MEILLRLDEDDPSLLDYSTMLRRFGARVDTIIGSRLGLGAAPYIDEAASRADGDIVLQFTDDMLCETRGWNKILFEAASPELPQVYAFDEKWPRRGNPGVSREWLRRAGCFYPKGAVHFHVDTIIFEVARDLGILLELPIVMRHNKGVGDALYHEIRTKPQNEALCQEWQVKLMEQMQ